MKPDRLVFVKLGGAAITVKSKQRTALPERIENLAVQIARAYQAHPGMRLVIGHGSGSFGHFSASEYGTKNGVHTPADWLGFARVWDDARQLNELVVHALLAAGLPVIAFPPSAWLLTDNRNPAIFQIEPIRRALENNMIPVVNGDVIFDNTLGGTILSTEEIFSLMADELHPDQIILASREPGVWKDYPANRNLAKTFSLSEFHSPDSTLRESAATDVTGGMAKKIGFMMDILKRQPVMEISITSGMDDTSVFNAIEGKPSGTRLQID